MRGYPFVESIIFALVVACMAIPLAWVTRARELPQNINIEETMESMDQAGVSAYLLVRSAHPYQSVRITLKGKEHVFTAEESEWDVFVDPHSIIELVVDVVWPEGTPETALLVELAPEEHESIQQTIWGEGSAYETLQFSWEGDGHE